MTSTPGWASPGSSDSPEPDSGDSPDPTPAAHDAPNGSPQDTTAAPEAATVPSTPPVSGVWSQQQPPPGRWHTPPGAGPHAGAQPVETTAAPETPRPEASASSGRPGHSDTGATQPPEAPAPPSAGQAHQGGWGQQWARPTPLSPENGGPRWGPTVPQYGSGRPPFVSMPAVPQPGVIPLRPLDAGEILRGALSTLRLHWRVALLLAFVVGLVTESVNAVISGLLIDDTRIDDLRNNPDPSAHDILHALSGTAAATSMLVILTSMVGIILTGGLLTVVISRAVLGRPTTLRSVGREVRPRLAQLVGLALLLPVALCAIVALPALPGLLIALAGGEAAGSSLASLGVICGVVVAIWQWNLWSLTAPALMLEKQGIMAAVKRSMKLVNGSWWRVLGVQLLMMLIAGLASLVLQLPFSLIADAVDGDSANSIFSAAGDSNWTTIIVVAIGGVISSTLTLPVSSGAVSLLYVDQRIRREALDVDLGRAAKVPGYEAAATGGSER